VSTTIDFIINRLINLVAEDNAIEDTIYHLHRALNTGRVDLERFLRVSQSRGVIHSYAVWVLPSFFVSPDDPRASRGTIHEEGLDRKDPIWDTNGNVEWFELGVISHSCLYPVLSQFST
jgi:hypothetical protein